MPKYKTPNYSRRRYTRPDNIYNDATAFGSPIGKPIKWSAYAKSPEYQEKVRESNARRSITKRNIFSDVGYGGAPVELEDGTIVDPAWIASPPRNSENYDLERASPIYEPTGPQQRAANWRRNFNRAQQVWDGVNKVATLGVPLAGLAYANTKKDLKWITDKIRHRRPSATQGGAGLPRQESYRITKRKYYPKSRGSTFIEGDFKQLNWPMKRHLRSHRGPMRARRGLGQHRRTFKHY